ncbi:hypothetical protein ASZ90_011016 [hydrocarbon metagenome]|uniref:Uncharacterized protein n=1 Tax=hydrocarbon metagenome TaxID=938273 RepID=A0A0W8FEJ3_9ZZZZ
MASGHVPVIAEGHNDPDAALVIDDPLKSWVFYAVLPDGGSVQYYRFRMDEGDRIRLMLQVPERGGIAPDIALIGPGIETSGNPPGFVRVPEAAGTLIASGTPPDRPSYEPFTPAAYYELVDIDIAAEEAGEYVVAVYDPDEGGRYALAVGYEEAFDLDEWLLIPIVVIGVRLWEGQSLPYILSPLIAALIIGIGLIFLRQRQQLVALTPFSIIGALAGLFYIGGGGMTLMQMATVLAEAPLQGSVIVTFLLALIPIVLGIAILRIALRRRAPEGMRDRIKIALLGAAGLVVWAGLLVGPALALLAAVLPYSPGH